MTVPLIVAKHIYKRLGGLTALAHVNLEIGAREVLALLSDNGAGKSTSTEVLAGAHEPSEGKLLAGGAR